MTEQEDYTDEEHTLLMKLELLPEEEKNFIMKLTHDLFMKETMKDPNFKEAVRLLKEVKQSVADRQILRKIT